MYDLRLRGCEISMSMESSYLVVDTHHVVRSRAREADWAYPATPPGGPDKSPHCLDALTSTGWSKDCVGVERRVLELSRVCLDVAVGARQLAEAVERSMVQPDSLTP